MDDPFGGRNRPLRRCREGEEGLFKRWLHQGARASFHIALEPALGGHLTVVRAVSGVDHLLSRGQLGRHGAHR